MESITAATHADVPQLADLLEILFAHEVELAPDRAKQVRALTMILDTPAAGTVFVARDGPAVVGTVSLHYTISTAEGDRVAWVEDVVVRPDRRGGGLGSRLIRHAIDFAQTANIPRLTLLTDGVNADAIRFYHRHGFRRSDMVTLRLYPQATTADEVTNPGPA